MGGMDEPPAGTKRHPASQNQVKDDEGGDTKERIHVFLGEFRILVPALGALLGFQLTASYSSGWSELSQLEKMLNLCAASSTAAALGFLLLPANYHRVTKRVSEDGDFPHFAQRTFGLCFIFVAVSLALSLFLQAQRVFDDLMASTIFGAGIFLLSSSFGASFPKVRARLRGKDGSSDRRAA